MEEIETMKKNILTVGLFLVVIGGLNIDALVAAETKSSAIATARDTAEARGKLDARERKIPLSDATTSWGYYGVTPESPDEKRLCYALYPGPIDLKRDEKHAIHPAQLWVCNIDGTGHRMLCKGSGPVHNGLQQSWVDDKRIVFASEGATCIVNADTGKMDFGPFEGFNPAHFATGGKVLMYPAMDSAKQQGLYELDTATGKIRLAVPHNSISSHAQYSPNGRKALFTTEDNTHLVVANLDGSGVKVLPGKKPMHFQWFDNRSLFGYVQSGVVGVDLKKHIEHEMYRWNLDGRIIEHLAGHGCHGAARADGKYFAGESWYFSDRIVLRLYSRQQSKPLADIFSHRFARVTWRNGGRHHVNPSFSRDGMRLYYKKAVNENTSHAFSCDLTGLVSPLE